MSKVWRTKVLIFPGLVTILLVFLQLTTKPICNSENYVALNDTTLLCKYELTNGEYKEYLDYLKVNSSLAEYASQYPDSGSLQYLLDANSNYYGAPYYTGYLNHPAYNDYPIIGITFEQVLKYCGWLTKKNDKCRFANGYRVFYRLPTLKEWKTAYGSGKMKTLQSTSSGFERIWVTPKILDSLKINSKSEKVIGTYYNIWNFKKLIYKDSIYTYFESAARNYSGPLPQPLPVTNSIVNEKGFFHMDDNVSEIVSDDSLAMGANFLSQLKDFNGNISVSYGQAEPWLGVRLIMEIRKINEP